MFVVSFWALQSIMVLAVAPEGTARFWPSLAHEGNYIETVVDMGENLSNFVIAVKVRLYCGPIFSFVLPNSIPVLSNVGCTPST